MPVNEPGGVVARATPRGLRGVEASLHVRHFARYLLIVVAYRWPFAEAGRQGHKLAVSEFFMGGDGQLGVRTTAVLFTCSLRLDSNRFNLSINPS